MYVTESRGSEAAKQKHDYQIKGKVFLHLVLLKLQSRFGRYVYICLPYF